MSVRELAAEGMTKAELEKAFKAALVAAYLDGAVTTVAPIPAVASQELRRPVRQPGARTADAQAGPQADPLCNSHARASPWTGHRE